MAVEIERKFLVLGDAWREAEGVRILQAYLCLDEQRTVRVRVVGEQAFLTIKGPSRGFVRDEFEYGIPVNDADQLLDLCVKPAIDKIRRNILFQGFVWEVDEFFGANAGLVVAEIELQSETEAFVAPDWIGREVTADSRYYNSSLTLRPFSTWTPTEPS